MVDVYKVNSNDEFVAHIASKEYVDAIIKRLVDEINSGHRLYESNLFVVINEKFLPAMRKETKIKAADIETDAEHSFVSNEKLLDINSKASSFEVIKQIDDTKEEIKEYIDTKLNELFNTPDMLSKLKDIIAILNEDDALSAIMDVSSCKADYHDLKAHSNSCYHLTDEDRTNLNILKEFITTGIDWEADRKSLGYIKNKPKAFPADGGDSDTVGGLSAAELDNTEIYDVVIGTIAEDYTGVTVRLDLNNYNVGEVVDLINNTEGSIYFRKGIYVLGPDVINTKENAVMDGCSANSVIVSADIHLSENNELRNLTMSECEIWIENNCKIYNCRFNKCTIHMGGNNCNIKDNTFDNCNYAYYNGVHTGNIVVYNRYSYEFMTLLGRANIVENNLTI